MPCKNKSIILLKSSVVYQRVCMLSHSFVKCDNWPGKMKAVTTGVTQKNEMKHSMWEVRIIKNSLVRVTAQLKMARAMSAMFPFPLLNMTYA